MKGSAAVPKDVGVDRGRSHRGASERRGRCREEVHGPVVVGHGRGGRVVADVDRFGDRVAAVRGDAKDQARRRVCRGPAPIPTHSYRRRPVPLPKLNEALPVAPQFMGPKKLTPAIEALPMASVPVTSPFRC